MYIHNTLVNILSIESYRHRVVQSMQKLDMVLRWWYMPPCLSSSLSKFGLISLSNWALGPPFQWAKFDQNKFWGHPIVFLSLFNLKFANFLAAIHHFMHLGGPSMTWQLFLLITHGQYHKLCGVPVSTLKKLMLDTPNPIKMSLNWLDKGTWLNRPIRLLWFRHCHWLDVSWIMMTIHYTVHVQIVDKESMQCSKMFFKEQQLKTMFGMVGSAVLNRIYLPGFNSVCRHKFPFTRMKTSDSYYRTI